MCLQNAEHHDPLPVILYSFPCGSWGRELFSPVSGLLFKFPEHMLCARNLLFVLAFHLLSYCLSESPVTVHHQKH